MAGIATEEKTAAAGSANYMSKQPLQLKRQVVVKSVVTEAFRQKAKAEMTDELKLVDAQIQQLENQYQTLLRQLEEAAKTGQNVSRQMDQLFREAQEKRNQLQTVKVQLSENLENLDRVANGELIVTGSLENFVEIGVGDNIYDKLRNAEIIVEDGVIKTINS